MLFIGVGYLNTGFSRVSESLLREFARHYEIHQFAINLMGTVKEAPWPVYGNDESDFYGQRRAVDLVETIRPDIVLVYHNTWYYPLVGPGLEKLRERLSFKIVLYLPIEGDYLPPYDALKLSGVDLIVAFTHFGKSVVERSARTLERRFPTIEVVPHGVDRSLFFPLLGIGDDGNRNPSKAEARATLFGERPDLSDAFIVLNANSNQDHKRIDLTIEGFAKFALGKPNGVRLCLHRKRLRRGADLEGLARKYQVEDRLTWVDPEDSYPDASDERLNLIYNACDVGLNTSMGEGWGLVNFEHAATGVPQVVPSHSALTEVWENSALYLHPKEGGARTPISFGSMEVDPEQLAEQLEFLYSSPSDLRLYGRKAFDRVKQKEFVWRNIADRWSEKLNPLFD